MHGGFYVRSCGLNVHVSARKQLLHCGSLFRDVGVQRKVGPLDVDVVFRFQFFNTSSADVAPRSYYVRENL